jgi:hypothetical protein
MEHLNLLTGSWISGAVTAAFFLALKQWGSAPLWPHATMPAAHPSNDEGSNKTERDSDALQSDDGNGDGRTTVGNAGGSGAERT